MHCFRQLVPYFAEKAQREVDDTSPWQVAHVQRMQIVLNLVHALEEAGLVWAQLEINMVVSFIKDQNFLL